MPGMIVITRQRSVRVMTWPYKIRIDGRPAGKVKTGASEAFTLEAGRHVVQTRAGRNGSKKLTVEVTDGGYQVLSTKPTRLNLFLTVPSVVVGGFLGRAVAANGFGPAVFAGIAAVLVVSQILSRVPGFFIALAPVPPPDGPPVPGEPAGRQPVWWDVPGE